MVDPLGVGLGALAVLVVVALHVKGGPEWRNLEDVSDELLEHRASTLADTGLPEPSSRAIGGGAGAGAVAGGEGGAELEAGGDAAAADEDGPWSLPDDEAETYEIEFVKEGATIEVSENETILDAGEDEGWDLPFACREGQCLSCGGHVTDGPSEDYLTHHGQEMLNEDELGEGYTLTCVAYPQADFSIETRESP
ncbi:MAG: 2Fe-2S iron-sulfur cluster-binding protein [Halobacteriales archaeon]|nr:2Fe-2S iron-sulfur cluster-binding protein [Halobacteriales archaeon]